MPSSVIGALRVSLGLDSAEFSTGATQAERRAYQMGERIGRSIRTGAETAKTALTGLAAAAGGTALVAAAQRAFDYADALADLSDRTGASTKLIQEFRYAAQLSGSGVDIADEALGKFTRSLGLAQAGSDAQVKLFRRLGVTSSDFDTAFRQTLDGLAKLPTLQQRNVAALQLFGKSAATLTGLMGQGSAGFNQLAKAASDLGIVLDDDLIRNAGQVNDKMDQMKMILSAQFASAIVKNADGISAMATAIASTAGAIANLWSQNPEKALAVLGGIAGARFGGAPGAAIGAIAGYSYGGKMAADSADGRTDIAFRQAEFQRAKDARAAAARRAQPAFATALGSPSSRSREYREADAEVQRQAKLYIAARKAAQAPKPKPDPEGGLPGSGTGEAATAAKAAASAAKAAARERQQAAEKDKRDRQRAADMLTRADAERISAIADLTVNVSERVAIERELNDQQRKAALDEIKRDEDLSQVEKDKLTVLTEEVYGLRQNLIQRRAEEEMAREALDAALARNQNEQDILSSQAGLARTARQRGEVELKILALQFEQMRATERAIIASQTATDQQKATARDQLGTIDKLEGYAQARVKRDNLSPLGRYLDGIPGSAAEVTESIEGIQANGIDRLIDGIADVRGGFEGLADTVKSVADDIIRQLLRIALQKAFAAVFGAALGGGKAPVGITSGDLGPGPGSVAAMGLIKIDGARAKGGRVVGGRNYLIGERGQEVLKMPRSGEIIPNDELGEMGGSRISVTQNINIPAGVDLATRSEVYRLAGLIKMDTMRAIDDRNGRRG